MDRNTGLKAESIQTLPLGSSQTVPQPLLRAAAHINFGVPSLEYRYLVFLP